MTNKQFFIHRDLDSALSHYSTNNADSLNFIEWLSQPFKERTNISFKLRYGDLVKFNDHVFKYSDNLDWYQQTSGSFCDIPQKYHNVDTIYIVIQPAANKRCCSTLIPLEAYKNGKKYETRCLSVYTDMIVGGDVLGNYFKCSLDKPYDEYTHASKKAIKLINIDKYDTNICNTTKEKILMYMHKVMGIEARNITTLYDMNINHIRKQYKDKNYHEYDAGCYYTASAFLALYDLLNGDIDNITYRYGYQDFNYACLRCNCKKNWIDKRLDANIGELHKFELDFILDKGIIY